MESPSVVKTFKYSTSHQPIFNHVLETPLHYRSFAQENGFMDASVSSYLKTKDPRQNPEENDLVCSNDDAEISIFDAQKYFSESRDPKDIKTLSPTHHKESQGPSALLPVSRLSSVSSADGYSRHFRTRSFHATPTASSEASWNSQTGLLSNPPGSIAVSLRNVSFDHGQKRNSFAKKWIFGRKCCCTGKKAVQVKEVRSDSEQRRSTNMEKANQLYTIRESRQPKERISEKAASNGIIPQSDSLPEDIGERKQKITARPLRLSSESHFASTPARQQRVSASGRPFSDVPGGFSFPILNPSQTMKPPIKEMIAKPITSTLEDPPRDSLEVFQPISRTSLDTHEGPISSNPGGNNTDRHSFTIPGSPISRVTPTDDDIGSDASSDLFEIESFSTQTTSCPLYRRRDSLDETPAFNVRRFAAANAIYGCRRSLDEPQTPSIAPSECYAPSEVSIDWSVTTAEGFDRASVSNFSVSASEIGFLRQKDGRGGETGNEGGKKKGNGLLLSCRHEKAVSVGPQPVKYTVEGPEIQLISTTMHVNGRPSKTGKPPLASSHSARLSLAFAV